MKVPDNDYYLSPKGRWEIRNQGGGMWYQKFINRKRYNLFKRNVVIFYETKCAVCGGACLQRKDNYLKGNPACCSTSCIVTNLIRGQKKGKFIYITKAGLFRYVGKNHPMAIRKDGYVKEARLIISEHIGRPLVKGERVFHLDGNVHNIDINNLRLVEKGYKNRKSGYKENCNEKV